uniref:Uncharacterized protein n=1 Tax=Panagrolaimus sp. ES5 TaxID=591445 RepID=A0AC34F628_9BILA
MSAPRGILSSHGSTPNNNGFGNVTFDPSTADNARTANPPSTPPPDPSKISAPVVDCHIKDEVELLRAGVMNVHGTHVKPQGEQK